MAHRTWNFNKAIALLAFWHGFSLLMITVFNWPREIIWLNFALSAAFILLAPVYYSLVLLIVCIPFYAVLPNPYFDALSIWRPLFVLLFAVWLFTPLECGVLLKSFKKKAAAIKNTELMPWDKVLGYFFVASLVITLIFGRFVAQGLKQLLFFANIYMFYLVLIGTVKTRGQIYGILKSAATSFAIIITAGYLQLVSTFFVGLNFFWVYWADNFSRMLYGNSFAQVALYSNSWFSYTGGWELRMFSLQPDSQSFAYICVFAIAFTLPLILIASQGVRHWLWSGLRFAGLAIMLSGTRAVWVGLMAPFFVLIWLCAKKIHLFFAKKTLWIFGIIFFFFAVSPLVNAGMRYIRFAKFEENFIARALSIYDLKEASNAGRVLIWKESLNYFAHKPWGVGLGNFLGNLSQSENYKIASEQINKRYNLPQKYITAHSLYLQILVELGVAGFALFVWFWARLGKTLFGFLRKNRDSGDPLTFLVFTSAMAFLWLLAAAFFDVTFFNDKVLIYLFLTLGLCGVVIKNYQNLKA